MILHGVELDEKLFESLGVRFAGDPKVFLHHGDILKLKIRDLSPGRRVLVVGNLPYGITSDLVLWLLAQHRDIRRAVVLMQREVAERLTAKPGERAAGSLTLSVHYRCEAERILEVPPTVFRPIPRVHSSLVAFRFRESPAVHPKDEAHFFRVIRAAFGERRKNLVNALVGGLNLPREQIQEAAEKAEFPPGVRGERLTLEDFEKLSDALVGLSPDESGPASSSKSEHDHST